jgi:C1A family cysteine protease
MRMTMTRRVRIREHVVEGKRLGRHINHDPRSLSYQVKPRASLAVSKLWKRVTPVLDQGNLGSCTGNAAVGLLGTEPFFDTLGAMQRQHLDEEEAVSVYSTATLIDNAPGNYPPDDTGSDGLSVAKACQNLKLISGYVHATSVDAVVTALQTGPVITGVNWYEGFDNPGANGIVTVGGSVRGGHEFEIVGVDVDAKMFRAVNSWGDGWGDHGYFQFSFADYDRLLHEDGDATQFVPLTAPAPTPTPTPGDNVDLAFISAADPWGARPHSWHYSTVAAKAYAEWRKAKGF